MLASTALAIPKPGVRCRSMNSTVTTADSNDLKSWWHEAGVIDPHGPIADDSVRQSHLYSVQVASAGSNTFYDSFVYETIPRSGKGKLCYPDRSDICNEDDQVSIEDDIGVTMGWSQFLYGKDAVVKITRTDDKPILSADHITIRPTNREFDVTVSNNAAFIRVPYNPETNGARFSVEFADDIFEYRIKEKTQQSTYVQDVNPSGDYYVQSYTDSMPVVGREPLNALLIFASPFPSGVFVPSTQQDIYEVQPGLVESLQQVTKSVVSFGPGVYWFTGKNRAILPSSVSWVYLAPGAYVKGAIEYNNPNSPQLKATGYGVLSGEQYVYQANPAAGYSNTKSDLTSLKMWRGNGVTSGQTWVMNGITTSAAPFNVMDFYGDNDGVPPPGFAVDITDYKQVGGYFGQTDGLEMYTNGRLQDVFYHVGDDGIKTYYSGVHAQRMIVWKTNNAPIIQMGWYPRNIEDIRLEDIDVIHCRYYSWLDFAPRALIGSSSSYLDINSDSTADITTTISNYTVANIRAEGISPGLISLNMLSNIDDFVIENAWIEELTPVPSLDISAIVGFTDKNHNNQKVSLGANSVNGVGLTIRGFQVGDTPIKFDSDNWDVNSAGRISIDPAFDSHYVVE
ncbi:uncharacterized protein N7484_003342 [Penicillium longicatenatum]|uniref:uncharacterized protein n=1 Tax=Penicillium longicatenatum TaxID=1561947 RepID=UPI0025467F0E|nr:uncharacterized protein N7484_003342 [Penicillium longicatenatum]KAJ5649619.1 hypothetical protein N7484_003342 [Penicillium longicatenatum]